MPTHNTVTMAPRVMVNKALRELWLAYRDLSDELPADDWDERDLDLWNRVTNHPHIQEIISASVICRRTRQSSD